MSSPSGDSVFRKKSLERLASPDRLDHLLHVVDRKSWLPLITIGGLLALLLAWSIVGTIRIDVEGRGILVRPRNIVAVQAPGDGRVVRIDVGVGDPVRQGQVLALIERPELIDQLRQARLELLQLEAQGPSAEARDGGGAPSVWDRIEQARGAAVRLRAERLATLDEEGSRLAEQRQRVLALQQSLEWRLERQREMLRSELISRAELDENERKLIDNVERLDEIETRAIALHAERSAAESEYLDRLQRIAEWSFGLERDVAAAQREISRLEIQIEQQGRLVSHHDGAILELTSHVGDVLELGDRLATIMIDGDGSPLESVSYLKVEDGKQVQVGMEIQISPDGVPRERYGSMRGIVVGTSPFPVSAEEMQRMAGNDALARSWVDQGLWIEVRASLTPASGGKSPFSWTSSSGPPHEVTAGTTTRVQIQLRKEHPIALVIPLLRSTAGVD